MAYVRQVGDRHKCEVRVTVDGSVYKANDTFDTVGEARAWGKEKEREFKAQKGGGYPTKTVQQLLTRWREEVAPARDGATWDINRLKAIEKRLEAMGLADLELSQFGPKQMAAVRRARLAEISPSSVNREETLLKTVWAAARHPDWWWTAADPFKDLGGIRGAKGVARRRKASWRELKKILRQLGYRPHRPEQNKTAEVGLAMLVALRTTLRSQEVLQLGDSSLLITPTEMVVTIEKHKTRYATQAAKRVPLMPKAAVLLARKCMGKGDAFFTVGKGSRDTLYRKAKKLAGVPDLTFHDLKRTSVLMLKALLTEEELMAVTGNASVETLRRHYLTDTAAAASRGISRALKIDSAKLYDWVSARAS